jgi:GNAT superfamily N-acetyltransferase
MMRAGVRECSLSEFKALAVPYLESHEAEHNLILGIFGQLASGEVPTWHPVSGTPRLWVIHAGDDVVGAAILTPPDDVALSLCVRGTPSVLAERLHGQGFVVPGVTGPSEPAQEFAESWVTLRQVEVSLRPERIHKLTAVSPAEGVGGRLRKAVGSDSAVIAEWVMGFGQDAEWELDGAFVAESALKSERAFLWCDSQPVSMAIWTRRTRSGCCIGAVYTPRQYRGNGYGEAVTAALSQHLLDSGLEFCCLYTDVENPISNHVFEKIGYRPVLDVNHYSFAPVCPPSDSANK